LPRTTAVLDAAPCDLGGRRARIRRHVRLGRRVGRGCRSVPARDGDQRPRSPWPPHWWHWPGSAMSLANVARKT